MASPSGAKTHATPVQRLYAMLVLERKDVYAVALYAVAIGATSLALPIATQTLVNTVAFGMLLQPLVVLTALVFLVLCFVGLLKVMQARLAEILQQRVFARLALDLAHRLPHARENQFDGMLGPAVVNKFFDVLIVQKAGASLLLDGLSVVLQAFVGMVLLAFYHPALLAFDIVLLAAMCVVVFGLGWGAVQTSVEESYAKHSLVEFLQELARNRSTFRTDAGAAMAVSRVDHMVGRYITSRRAHFRILLRQIIGSVGLQAFASAALLGMGGWLVINRQLSLGQLIASELVVTSVVAGIAKFGKHLESYYDLLAAADKLGHLQDLEPERSSGGSPSDTLGPSELELRDLSVEVAGVRALNGASARANVGERIAIVGAHGAGKSALAECIYALREPTTGSVLLDGVDSREVAPTAWRTRTALVRGIEVFTGTIEENIRVGRDEVSASDVRDALRDVGLLDVIRNLSDGMNTLLDGEGDPLTQGQLRRLMLARAIVGGPSLIVVDEVLDGFDEGPRADAVEALMKRTAPWTLLVITHRSDIMWRCDRVWRVAHGTIEDVRPEMPRTFSRGGEVRE
ncbi:MAG: ABC transporter ATP-binding protein [Deltaproteobacteria bacterium]|nr:ABC transporter ATP-binding protein [Deltaproteobacteria bacterium]